MRKRILYTGIDPEGWIEEDVFHIPLISMEMRSQSNKETQDIFNNLFKYTHILFTSKYSVRSFFRYMKDMNISKSQIESVFLLAVGTYTFKALEEEGVYIHYVGNDETEIGTISLLENIELANSNILIPQSSLTSPKLTHYLIEKSISYEVVILYDILKKYPYSKACLSEFDKIIFTSPIALDTFFEIYKDIPSNIEIQCIGLMTRCHLQISLDRQSKEIDKKILL